jgi:hypothetical protein
LHARLTTIATYVQHATRPNYAHLHPTVVYVTAIAHPTDLNAITWEMY